jgi:flagellar biosynthesis/type III secretory pathway chaperone
MDWMGVFPSSKEAADLLLRQTEIFKILNDFDRVNFVEGMILAAQRQLPDRAFEILRSIRDQLDPEGDYNLKGKLQGPMLSIVQLRIENCAADLEQLIKEQSSGAGLARTR